MPVRWLRAFSGVIAGGVVVLTLVVIGAAVVGRERDFPGPGSESIVWHVATAILVVAAQVQADRRRGVVAVAMSIVIIAATVLLLWTQWWDSGISDL